MRKNRAENSSHELRPEYDFSTLKGGRRGKYFKSARQGSNLVLIDSELAKLFPDAATVNRALRLVVRLAAAVDLPPRRGAGTKPIRS